MPHTDILVIQMAGPFCFPSLLPKPPEAFYERIAIGWLLENTAVSLRTRSGEVERGKDERREVETETTFWNQLNEITTGTSDTLFALSNLFRSFAYG